MGHPPSKIEWMAEKQPDPKPKEPEEPKPAAMDDDVVGKAYDSRLMGRLVRYLAPYKLQVAISAVAIIIKSAADVLGPYFVKVAVDLSLIHI